MNKNTMQMVNVSDGINLPKDWEIKKLGEVVDVLDNLRKPITKRDRVEGEFPYYGATGILSFVDNYLFSEKLVLVGEDGAKWLSGDCTAFIAEGKYWVNNHAHVLRPIRKIILDEWIVYFLNFSDLTPFITGMTVPKLNQEKMRSIEIPLPPIAEQQRIVAILDEAFAAIGRAKTNAEQNLKNAKELFESYLQGAFENEGEGWEEKTLQEVYDVRDGTHDSPKYQDDGYPLITSKNLKNGKLTHDNIKFISKTDFVNINKRSKVDRGDVLFAMIGTIGNPVVIEEEPAFAIKNVALFKVGNNQSSYYLKYFLDSKQTIEKMMNDAKGTTQKFVGLGYLRAFPISIPSVQHQQAIVQQLDTLRAETQKLEAVYQQKIADLDELKKSILQKAFNGELTTQIEVSA